MSNVFITQYFDWNRPESPRVRLVNRLLRLIGYQARVIVPEQTGEMTSVEQRINLYHLISQVLAYGVAGAVVEIGCHAGSSSVLFQKVIDEQGAPRDLHVFDGFFESTPANLVANFDRYGLRPPIIHAGDLETTLPDELPRQIAFAHLDIGCGDHSDRMEALVRRCLEAVYPRMAPGGVMVVADYFDPETFEADGVVVPTCAPFVRRWGQYPQVRKACDTFLADKPEKVCMLYGGEYSHGFFRKVAPATR